MDTIIKDDFILENIIMPDKKIAYKIIFIDKQNLDNQNYYRRLSIEERSILKPYFMEIQGHWSEAHQGFVFIKEISTSMIKEAIRKANNKIPLSREQIEREKLQAYFTPIDVVKKMQEYAHISENDIVLDPSAGIGNLVNGLSISKERIYLIEPNPEFCNFLKRNGYIHVIQSTFEEAIEKGQVPNNISKILMNPPFSKQNDLKHISLAYKLLAPGGTLISIVGKNSVLERDSSGKESKIFQEFYHICQNSKSHQLIELPEGTFEKSGTICDTYMITLEKQREKVTNTSRNIRMVEEDER